MVADCLDYVGEIMFVVGRLGHAERLQLADGIAIGIKRVRAGGLHLVVAQHTPRLKQVLKMLRMRRDIKLSF